MLRAALRDFYAYIRTIDDALADAFHLMTYHDGVFPAALGPKPIEREAAFGLLQGADDVPLAP